MTESAAAAVALDSRESMAQMHRMRCESALKCDACWLFSMNRLIEDEATPNNKEHFRLFHSFAQSLVHSFVLFLSLIHTSYAIWKEKMNHVI